MFERGVKGPGRGDSAGRGSRAIATVGFPPKGGTIWTETVLHSLAGEPGDGQRPFAGLIVNKAGKLIGTTCYGRADNGGTVLQVRP